MLTLADPDSRKAICGFFGITDLRFVRAKGLAMGDTAKAAALASARSDIAIAVGRLANPANPANPANQANQAKIAA